MTRYAIAAVLFICAAFAGLTGFITAASVFLTGCAIVFAMAEGR